MVIFAEKHFSKNNAKIFSFLINIAIYFRAFAAIVARFAKQLFLPFLDFMAAFSGIYLISNYWSSHVKSMVNNPYPSEFFAFAVPSYILIWLGSVYFSAGYDKPTRLEKIAKGIGIGTGIILIGYALLPEHYRFSRALILIGSAWSLLSMLLLRILLHFLYKKEFQITTKNKKRFAVVGEADEAKRVSNLLSQTSLQPGFIGLISHESNSGKKDAAFMGSIEQIKEIIDIYKIDELIFCAKNLSSEKIIDYMAQLGNSNVDFKIAPPETMYIIGSNSIDTSGDLYVIDFNSINKIANRRNKRLLDVITSLLFFLTSPLLCLLMKQPLNFILNCLRVLFGWRTWVGYMDVKEKEVSQPHQKKLPILRKGVISSFEQIKNIENSNENIKRINLLYSKDYTVWKDLLLIIKGFRSLGN
jgi:hypothetical protein